ncbi:hypothetical protein LAPL110952_12230 [Lactiplantibacillus plajomi]
MGFHIISDVVFQEDVIASLNEYTEGTSKTGVPFLHGRTVAFVLWFGGTGGLRGGGVFGVMGDGN